MPVSEIQYEYAKAVKPMNRWIVYEQAVAQGKDLRAQERILLLDVKASVMVLGARLRR